MTSHKISHFLARNVKPYSEGKVMKQAIVMFAEECCSINILTIVNFKSLL